MVLWTIFAGLTMAALAAVLWPYLRAPRGDEEPPHFDTAVYRDQLCEIEADRTRGIISEQEAEAARIEISRRLLSAAETGKNAPEAPAGKQAHGVPAIAFVCAVLCIPVASTVLYLVYGSPALPDRPLAVRLGTDGETQSVDALVARVEERLRAHPEDGRGWDVIAPVYLRQGRYDDAAEAYDRALRLLGGTPERLAGYGDALVRANNGLVTEKARRALERAHAGDDSLVRARYWLAVAHEQDGDHERAVRAWRALLDDSGENAPWRGAVARRLEAVEAKLGTEAPGTKTARAAPDAGGAPDKTGPDTADIAAARDMSESDRAAMIDQMVEGLAARLERDGGPVEDWIKLVRSYSVLGKKEAAAETLAEARETFGDDAQALASLNRVARSLGL